MADILLLMHRSSKGNQRMEVPPDQVQHSDRLKHILLGIGAIRLYRSPHSCIVFVQSEICVCFLEVWPLGFIVSGCISVA